METMDIFALKQFSYQYPNQTQWALDDVNMTIAPGEFVLLMGPSGCGKSTLARVLSGLVPGFYGGALKGEVFYQGKPIVSLEKSVLSREVGYVFQDPENQMVMGEVEKDIAFGCENLGFDVKHMRRRVSETLSYLGLNQLRHQQTDAISSGEKQKVAIGSILAMGPKVFIFDEPTSQLDPYACKLFIDIIKRLHEEEGATIILIEHRYDEVFALVDRIVYLEQGKICIDASPREFIKQHMNTQGEHLPILAQLFKTLPVNQQPLTIVEGRRLLKNINCNRAPLTRLIQDKKPVLMDINNVSFRYQKDQIDPILNQINLKVFKGECLAILGENGAGKSTLLKLMAGLCLPDKGSILLSGKDISKMDMHAKARALGLLTQNPNDYLFHESVSEEIAYTAKNLAVNDVIWQQQLFQLLAIEDLQDNYPRDLSCGQRQRVALASVLIAKPALLLCDEPTRGMDIIARNNLLKLLLQLKSEGLSIVLVTQDVDFAAEFADRICIISEGRVLDEGAPHQVLDNNLFYSTRINKLFQGSVDGVISMNDAKQVMGLLHE